MKWISVEKKLPPCGSWVLCYGPNKQVFTAGYNKDKWNGGGVDRDKDGGYWEGDCDEEIVTHWMPLPESPEKEKGQQETR